MIKHLASLVAASTLLALVLVSPAFALSNRAWVSGHGTDTAGCGSPASACRTFQYVHDNIIAAGGEIDVLDPGGYGTITITKALSIVNDGVGTVGVQQPIPGQNAITINAGASDAVFLRGLNIEGLGAATIGVFLNSGGSLNVVNCTVRHFATGISVAPSSGVTTVSISNTIATDNSFFGIALAASAGGTVAGIVSQTTATRNTQAGISLGGNGGGVLAEITDGIFANNNTGIAVNGGASIILGRTIATGNHTGVSISGGSASSYGDNKIDGNPTANVSGTLSSLQTR